MKTIRHLLTLALLAVIATPAAAQDQKISAMTTDPAPAVTAVVPVVRAGANYKMALSSVLTLDPELAAIYGLTSAASKGIMFTGAGTGATYDLTAAGLALLDDADASAQQTTLGLVPGTNVQAYDADLSTLASSTAAFLTLSDDASVAAMLTTLGGLPLAGGTLTGPVYTPNTTFAYSATPTLNTNTALYWAMSDDLDGNMDITLSNVADGRAGTIGVRQNGTGGFSVTLTATGATMVSVGSADVRQDADDYSLISYACGTIDAVLTCYYSLGGPASEALGNATATSLTLSASGLHLLDSNASHDLIINPGSDLTADRTLTVTTGDAARTLTLTDDVSLGDGDKGDVTISSDFTIFAIDSGVVDAAELASTAVTPGSYTAAGITVDADGRLTAASSATTISVNRVSATPATFTTTAGAATLDVSANNDHRQTDSMDATTVLTLTGCSDGYQGTIYIVQDGTGRAVTFAHSGRTVYDSQAVPTTASARIAIGYLCVSTDSLYVFPVEMTAQ